MRVGFVLRILRVKEFSKVMKSLAERKIMKVLSQGKLKYNIIGRNLSGLCDFNDDFLFYKVNAFLKVSVVNGWKVWLFVEGSSISNILTYYFLLSKKKQQKWKQKQECLSFPHTGYSPNLRCLRSNALS